LIYELKLYIQLDTKQDILEMSVPANVLASIEETKANTTEPKNAIK